LKKTLSFARKISTRPNRTSDFFPLPYVVGGAPAVNGEKIFFSPQFVYSKHFLHVYVFVLAFLSKFATPIRNIKAAQFRYTVEFLQDRFSIPLHSLEYDWIFFVCSPPLSDVLLVFIPDGYSICTLIRPDDFFDYSSCIYTYTHMYDYDTYGDMV
jgi:hypothetical protein